MARLYTIEELINLGMLEIGDGYRAKNSELSTADGFPFARAGNIQNGFDFSYADRFPEKDIAIVGRKVSMPGDTVFTSKGSVGRLAFVSAKTTRFVYSPQLCYWRSLDDSVIDPRYLHVWMNGAEFRHQIDYLKCQTDMADYVSLRDQRRMKITLPDISTQRSIADVIFELNDKIYLNSQTNGIFEQIAQAIFKSWFVDFDPVKAKIAAKAEGRDPLRAAMTAISGKSDAELDGMPVDFYDQLASTAGLFPDDMADSETGEIPVGWEVGTLGAITRLAGANVGVAELEVDEPYFGLEHLPRRSIALDTWGTSAGLESGKRRFTKQTILFGRLRPYFHKVGVAPIDGVCSTDILAIEPTEPVWFGVSLCHLSSAALIDYADRVSNGAKMPRVGWSDLARYPIVLADVTLASVFNSLVCPLAWIMRE